MTAIRTQGDWLNLIDHSGPFFSVPVLKKYFPQGLDGIQSDLTKELRSQYRAWSEAKEHGDQTAAQTAWLRYVLNGVLDYPVELIHEGPGIASSISARVPEFHETIRPDIVVVDPDRPEGKGKPRILIHAYPRGTSLSKPVSEHLWKEFPLGRMTYLLRSAEVRLGIVTNGEEWALINAPLGEASSVVTWQAVLWLDEPVTLQALVSLLGARRLFGVPDGETLEALFAQSADYQQEVTEQLGLQVRRSIEILVQQLDRANRERGGVLLSGVTEAEVYEASVTFMMRLVFLFFAEETRLLPLDDELYSSCYAASTIREQLREAADKSGEELLERLTDAYPRLLATFRAVHGGVHHNDLMIPPYGGHLFDPDRFQFLEGREKGSSWRSVNAKPLPIHNRTVLHLLESLQTLDDRKLKERRRLSFRSLDIEQIGHVYEGLLDHTVKKAEGVVVSLRTSAKLEGDEPEIRLSLLEEWRGLGEAKFSEKLEEETSLSAGAIKKALAQEVTPEDEQRLFLSCNNEAKLVNRVRPFLGLVRRDSSDLPVVILDGGFYVTAGSDRRSTGTHYTPRSLTEPIVKYTLEPLVYEGVADGAERESWKLRSPKELLDLKICDLTCGSGAFLVQACRYMSARLVEAWSEIETEKPGESVVSPEGDSAKVIPFSCFIPPSAEERLILARRLVAERCLYGVDRNHLAVEMAKLSLWLITLDKNRPFTFLDHHLKCGDSLLGVTSLAQIEHFSLDAESDPWVKQRNSTFQVLARESVAGAAGLYKEIAASPVLEIRDSERKEKMLIDAMASTSEFKVLADLLVGTTIASGQVRGDKFFEKSHKYFQNFCDVFDQRVKGEERKAALDELRIAAQSLLDDRAPESQKPRKPFHWALEYPEVFGEEGFDAIIGNPPFVGGQKITANLGTDYRDYLVRNIAGDTRGSADLCAYFLLRAASLLRLNGTFGLLATNTIAQGDTREVGLAQVQTQGFRLYRAVSSRKWPGDANLEVAHLWARKGEWKSRFVLEEKSVTGITSYLSTPGASVGTPSRLFANAHKSYQGSNVLGMGFILKPEEAQSLILKDRRNEEVILPYLNGEDLNQRPDQSPSRWVINFRDWPLERAEGFPDCMRIIRERVKPERDRLANGDATARDRARRWWQFARPTNLLYSAIRPFERVLAVSIVTHHVSFSFVPTNIVFAHRLALIVFDDLGSFAVLESFIHEAWARAYSSSLETRINYSPSDCLETFPFPESQNSLFDVASNYIEHRKGLMLDRSEGLTQIFNRFHDKSDVSSGTKRLRELHQQLNYEVASSYGWSDLDLEYGYHETKQGFRFTMSNDARLVVLDRLLALNHARHMNEVAISEPKGKGRKKRRGKVTESKSGQQASLF